MTLETHRIQDLKGSMVQLAHRDPAKSRRKLLREASETSDWGAALAAVLKGHNAYLKHRNPRGSVVAGYRKVAALLADLQGTPPKEFHAAMRASSHIRHDSTQSANRIWTSRGQILSYNPAVGLGRAAADVLPALSFNFGITSIQSEGLEGVHPELPVDLVFQGSRLLYLEVV